MTLSPEALAQLPGNLSADDWQKMMDALNFETPDLAPPKPLPPLAPENHIVYFVGGETGPIKIGWTQNLRNRMPCLQSGSNCVLIIYATQCAPKAKERWYHRHFAGSRLHGEWFERTPVLMDLIERLNRRCGGQGA